MKLRHKVKFLALAFVVAVVAGVFLSMGDPAISAGQDQATEQASAAPETVWTVRCEEEGERKGECEMFQRLVSKDNGQRVAEFAVGFPEKDKKDTARGVVVLPLGILLTEDIMLQIGDKKTVTFKPRYCTPEGCFAYINLSKSMLDLLRKSEKMTISVKSMQGQNVNIEMQLKGFGQGLKKIS